MMMTKTMKVEADWDHLDSRPPILCFHLHRAFWLPHPFVKCIPDRTRPEELCAVAVRKPFPIKAHKLNIHTFQPNKNLQVVTRTKSFVWYDFVHLYLNPMSNIFHSLLIMMNLSFSFFSWGLRETVRVLIHYKALRQWLNNHASPQNINAISKPPKEWELVSVTPTLHSK